MPDVVSASVRRRACEACTRLVLVSELSRTGRCTACAGLYLRVNGPHAAARTVDVVAPFEKDAAAIAFVEAHPDGATLAEVGDAFHDPRCHVGKLTRHAATYEIAPSEYCDVCDRYSPNDGCPACGVEADSA